MVAPGAIPPAYSRSRSASPSASVTTPGSGYPGTSTCCGSFLGRPKVWRKDWISDSLTEIGFQVQVGLAFRLRHHSGIGISRNQHLLRIVPRKAEGLAEGLDIRQLNGAPADYGDLLARPVNALLVERVDVVDRGQVGRSQHVGAIPRD